MQNNTRVMRPRNKYVRLLYPLSAGGIIGSIAVHAVSWFGVGISDSIGVPLHIAALLSGFLIVKAINPTVRLANCEVDVASYFPFLTSKWVLSTHWILSGYYLFLFIMTIRESDIWFWRMGSMV